MLQNFFKTKFVQIGSKTPIKKPIVKFIPSKNLIKLHNLYMKKLHTATNRAGTKT